MANKATDYAIHEERPYGILISGHYKEVQDYTIYRPSGGMDWLLMFTVSGQGEIHAGGEIISCEEGDVAILLPGMAHHYGTKGDHWEFLWAHFIPDPRWSTWLHLPEKSDRFLFHHLTNVEQISSVKDALVRMTINDLPSGRSELHRRLSELALEEALIQICLTTPSGVDSSMDSRVSEVLSYLQQSVSDKVSLPELARRCCLSTSRLSHLFKEQVGDTILNTVCKFRLEKAAQLLTGTNRQVAEIASDVGFDCTRHFTRKFKEAFGETPGVYRKRNQADKTGNIRKGRE